MSSKVAIAVSTALMTMSLSSVAGVEISKPSIKAATGQVKKAETPVSLAKNNSPAIFTAEANIAAGNHRYIVRLSDDPVALYRGNLAGYKATSPAVQSSTNGKRSNRKLNTQLAHVKHYRSYLTARQDTVISQAKSFINNLDVKQRTSLAFNGLVIEMTQQQAQKLAAVPGIAHIKRETLRHLTTDVGPEFIGAPSLWNGTAGSSQTMGEDIVVGVIDTGINSDHPSFADIGGDGYDHTNPNGQGVYSGDCATEEWAGLCNDKLIGVHSYPLITDQYPAQDPDVPLNGVDHGGHGSHTASTTAGNILKDITLDNGYPVAQMSGVAPHANIISYQVCLPGDTGDTLEFNGCFPSLTVLAIEHAIEAGVDVLNYSIGGGSASPWEDADSLAFLAARKAGIHVATSAGNDGPEPGTVGSPGEAPWITTVGAGTHTRSEPIAEMTLNGDVYNFTASSGPDFTDGFSDTLLHSGVVDADNVEGCNAFATGAFVGVTALISRGTCNFSDKIINAEAAGASSVIVYNNRDGDDYSSVMSGLNDTGIPSAFISENAGTAVIAALASSAELVASYAPFSIKVTAGGEMADFSSRGANVSVPDIISPSITAPGVGILAAYADEQSALMKDSPDPSDYSFLNGTSMASPHIAGALALLAKLQPSWTPAEAQSALMLTANQTVLKEDGITAAGFFDMGSGYANVAYAAATGLVMDENYENYLAADPATGGKPSALNLPSMANASCVNTCSWTRTVTATTANEWKVSAQVIDDTSGLTVTVSPESFELAAGESQELSISANISSTKDTWTFANINLIAADMPEVNLPVAVKVGDNNLPDNLTLNANSTKGSTTFSGYQSSQLTNIAAKLYTKQQAIANLEEELQEGLTAEFTVELDEDAPLIWFALGETSAPDLDLYVYDGDKNLLGSSTTTTSDESVSLTNLSAGTYFVEVINYAASTPDGTDAYKLDISAIYRNESSLSEDISVSVIESATEDEFSLKFDWDFSDSLSETSTGLLNLASADASATQDIAFSLIRGKNGVVIDIDNGLQDASQPLVPGQSNTISFNIAANTSAEDQLYTFTAVIPADQDVVNISNDGLLSGDTINWTINRKAGESAQPLAISFDLIPRAAGTDLALVLTSTLNSTPVTSSYNFSVADAPPTAVINAPASVDEKESITLDGSASMDPNGDQVTYLWQQVSGTAVSFSGNSASISFTAPKVSGDENLDFSLTVSDSTGNTVTQTTSVKVNNKGSGGSFGWLLLLTTPVLFLRRRLVK